MTGDENGPISGRERLIVTAILAVVAGMTLIDVVADSYSGGSVPHISIELLTAGAAVLALGWMWIRFFRLRRGLAAARRSLEGARVEAARWRDRHGEILQGMSRAIDQQLDAWTLTPAEKEVAFLLLKGLSFKEIAPVRGASERTVRQQALAVYAKSGLAGRAELSAFFLEDLLAPAAPASATNPSAPGSQAV
ncbi:MAG: helix-turn-helix transcriptional regulator [Candidatus Binatia bacterium]